MPISQAVCIGLAVLFLAACASDPDKPSSPDADTPASELAARAGLEDGRGRFREVFCAVMEDHGSELPDYRPCEQALNEDGAEDGATGNTVSMGQTEEDYLVLLVPGLGWECFAEWLDVKGTAPKHVATYGYEVKMVPVDGLSSSENNAEQIRDYIVGLAAEQAGRPIILAG